jgi:hypothetical protein
VVWPGSRSWRKRAAVELERQLSSGSLAVDPALLARLFDQVQSLLGRAPGSAASGLLGGRLPRLGGGGAQRGRAVRVFSLAGGHRGLVGASSGSSRRTADRQPKPPAARRSG